jgi:hypothetical protein
MLSHKVESSNSGIGQVGLDCAFQLGSIFAADVTKPISSLAACTPQAISGRMAHLQSNKKKSRTSRKPGKSKNKVRSTHSLLWLLPHNSIFVLHLFLALLSLFVFTLLFFAVSAVGQAAQEFSRFRRNAVHSAGVNLDATIQCTAGLLKVDSIAFLEQRHIMEVIDQSKIPGIGCIDLVIRSHLHPLLEIGKYWYAFHRGNCGASNHHDSSIEFILLSGRSSRCSRVRRR